MLFVKRCVLAPLVLSLFIVVLGSAHRSIWSCVAHALVALLRVYYRAACFFASELFVSWFWGRALLGIVLQSCMPILKNEVFRSDWYTIVVLIPDVEL